MAGEFRFHHLHLNSTNPKAAIEFYAARFASEPARFAGTLDALRTQDSWLLFTGVRRPPPWSLISSIWHFGWGAEDMQAEYARQLAIGTPFFTTLTDISDIANPNATPGTFYYAYVLGPDKALIELNTANHHVFGHLHLFSADPVTAAAWYMTTFGATRRSPRPLTREPRFYRGVQIGPSASLMISQVNLIIYPFEYARKAYAADWRDQAGLAPTAGRVVDHLAFGTRDFDAAVRSLRTSGISVSAAKRIPGTNVWSVFLEGPDRIRIEVVREP